MDPTFWEPHCKRFEGIFFVVDLSTFDEEFIDENGQKKNKLEHAQSVWNSLNKSNSIFQFITGDKDAFADIPKMAVMTKRKEFLKKLDDSQMNRKFNSIYEEFEKSHRSFNIVKKHRELIHMVKKLQFPETDFFPLDYTMMEIMDEYKRVKYEKTILVLGPPKCGKSTVIDAILSSQNEKVSLDDLKGNMIHSQYDLDFAVITEHTTRELEQNAAQNLKYFPVIKDHTDEPDKEKAFYDRLSRFSKEDLENINYAVIRNDNLLCPGYIRQNGKSESMAMEISVDVSNLIDAYYGPNKGIIHSTKFTVNGNSIYNLWESTAIDPSMWSSRRNQIQGIIYVVDLLSYGRSIVDEHGQRRNELEHTLSVWESFKELDVPMMAVLTKTDQYSKIQSEELIKHISFQVKSEESIFQQSKSAPINAVEFLQNMEKSQNPFLRGDTMRKVLTDSPTFSHLDQSCIRAILLKLNPQSSTAKFPDYLSRKYNALCKVLEKLNCKTIELAAHAFYRATMEVNYGRRLGTRSYGKCKKCGWNGWHTGTDWYEGSRPCGKDTEYYQCSNPRCRNTWSEKS